MATLGVWIPYLLVALLVVGCFRIGLKTIWNKEISLSKSRTWTGYSTLIVGIPLLLAGMAGALALVGAVVYST